MKITKYLNCSKEDRTNLFKKKRKELKDHKAEIHIHNVLIADYLQGRLRKTVLNIAGGNMAKASKVLSLWFY